MSSPFRDEVEALRRENERLVAELADARRARRGLRSPAGAHLGTALALGVGLPVVDVAVAMMLRPWLNAGSDARFWAALAILAGVTLTAAFVAVGYKRAA